MSIEPSGKPFPPQLPTPGLVGDPVRVWQIAEQPDAAPFLPAGPAWTLSIVDVATLRASLDAMASAALPEVVIVGAGPAVLGWCAELRSQEKWLSVPIVLVGGSADDSTYEAALGDVFADWVPAPARPALLGARLGHAARVKRLDDRGAAFARAAASEQVRAVLAENKLRRLAESGLVGIVETDLAGHIVSANAAFLSMIGHTADELARGGPTMASLTPAMWKTADDRAGLEARARGAYSPYEKELRRPDGTRVHVLMGGGLIEREGHLLVSLVLDVSVRRAVDVERDRVLEAESYARSEAERISNLKDEFLATVSHELRTPLNAIVGWSDLLRSDTTGQLDRARALETISRNARAQSKMIEDILDVSRIINGNVSLELRRVDLNTVVAQAVEAVTLAVNAKGLTLKVRPAAAAVILLADAERMQQVVTNLLNNAIKFTPNGGSIDLLVSSTAREAAVSVTDSGIGISQDFLPNVFERFRQADASTTRRKGGLGLGLSIVRHIVELHGGRVAASSPGPGQGATFVVELPLPSKEDLVDPSSAERTTPVLVGASAPTDLAGLSVLLVDDTEDSLAVTSALLESLGCRVKPVTSSAAALAALDETVPDVLISDLAMPDEDGFALVRRLRDRPPTAGGDLPAVALSAYARDEDRARALDSGFQAHLPKPVSASRLVQVLSHLPRKGHAHTNA